MVEPLSLQMKGSRLLSQKKKIRKAYDQEQGMYIYREKWTNNGVTYGINKETAVSMKEMSCWSNVKHSPEGMLY